ncbi:toxin ChpB [Escherichia coli]|nr:toxin ChpB [Escherichia coli]
MLVGFDPASGHEQQGAGRPALVLSVQAFNQLGMTLVAPITQGGNFARYAGFSVPLHCEEGDVHGVVLVNQVRMMDLHARLAKRIGLAADEVVEEALLRLQRWWNKVCLFIAGIKKPLLTEARRSGLLRQKNLFILCALEGGNDFSFSGFCVSQPSTFTHLPFSRSL